MKKFLVLFTAITLLFVSSITSNVSAQGTYGCAWLSPLANNNCTPSSVNCATGYQPDTNRCNQLTNDPTACNAQQNLPCIGTSQPQPPAQNPGDTTRTGTYHCVANTPTCVDNCADGYEPACVIRRISGVTSVCESPTTPTNCVPQLFDEGDQGDCIRTAIGCVPIENPNDIAGFFLGWGLGIAGGIATLLIIVAAFIIITSSGDPKRIQAGKELLTAAISGLILIIFSIFILRLIGITILGGIF